VKKRRVRDMAASVHQRLLNKSRQAGRPFSERLQYYAVERFLYRRSKRAYADRFILKGDVKKHPCTSAGKKGKRE
jgi:hypothetical protein